MNRIAIILVVAVALSMGFTVYTKISTDKRIDFLERVIESVRTESERQNPSQVNPPPQGPPSDYELRELEYKMQQKLDALSQEFDKREWERQMNPDIPR